jgi:hypothetical protein
MQLRFQFSWRGEGNLVLGRQAAGLTRRANCSLPRGKSPGWQPATESAKLAHIQSNVNPDCISLRFNR